MMKLFAVILFAGGVSFLALALLVASSHADGFHIYTVAMSRYLLLRYLLLIAAALIIGGFVAIMPRLFPAG